MMEKGDASVSIDLLVRALGLFGIHIGCTGKGKLLAAK